MNVWVVAETPALAAELVSGAGLLAPSAPVTVFSGGDAEAVAFVARRGAAKVFAMPLADHAMWEDYVPVLAALARADRPSLILVGATKRGKDVAAQLAAHLDAPCVSDCKGLSREGEVATVRRMVYGGLAMKTMTTRAATLVATVTAKTYDPLPASEQAAPVERLAPSPGKVRVVGREGKVSGSVDLGEAARVVSVGRGFAEQDELGLARDLAAAMGAELACSRPIAEFFKWLPEEVYVGISGQVIRPQVYLAAGISGQAQHMTGVRDAKVIVSVNKDENAPILALSDYYFLGDLKEVLPALARAFRAQ